MWMRSFGVNVKPDQLVSLSMQSPNGKLVASGAIDGIINLFDLQTGRLLHTLEGTVQLGPAAETSKVYIDIFAPTKK